MSSIKVVLGANIKRESVLIDPKVSAAEPTITGGNVSAANENPEKNVIARAGSPRAALKQAYGR